MCVFEMDFLVKYLDMLQWPEKNIHVIYEEMYRLMITFFNYKFNVRKYYKVSCSISRNSFRCNIKTSQLVLFTGMSF